ncbi:MAG: hypothetical protein K6T30_00255 [Alicyclobacillus sp.]|nr:hypothetical protein [Alicyclobacillus sp.]
MSELLEGFADLLGRMEKALVDSDVEEVRRLTERQQLYLSDIVRAARDDQSFRGQLRQWWPRLQRQLEVNARLLEQGIALANGLLRTLSPAIRPEAGSAYTAR